MESNNFESVGFELQKLREQFSRVLPEKINDIRKLHLEIVQQDTWDRQKLQELYRLSHNLSGTAGTFGLRDISTTARNLETQLQSLLRSNTLPSEEQKKTMARLIHDEMRASTYN